MERVTNVDERRAEPGDNTVVRVRRLRKTFGDTGREPIVACDDIDLRIGEGERLALTGPSGSGKSTLLHLLGGLARPDSGTIDVGGNEITSLSRTELSEYRGRIGFVFQRFHLIPVLTALENVMLPVLPRRVAFDKKERAATLLRSAGLDGRENALPAELSGGQQQRVAIARALIGEPVLVLADEPTGNLDSRTGAEISKLLFSLRAKYGTTVVLATHDEGLTERCDRAVHLVDGRITAG